MTIRKCADRSCSTIGDESTLAYLDKASLADAQARDETPGWYCAGCITALIESSLRHDRALIADWNARHPNDPFTDDELKLILNL